MRNAAAARLGDKRYVIAGLVDTSGYAADVRAKYEGFFITDSPIKINGSDLTVGAYGFGFTQDGKMQILDLQGNQALSVSTTKDSDLTRPRPLMMSKAADGLRFYNGKDYVTITAKLPRQRQILIYSSLCSLLLVGEISTHGTHSILSRSLSDRHGKSDRTPTDAR